MDLKDFSQLLGLNSQPIAILLYNKVDHYNFQNYENKDQQFICEILKKSSSGKVVSKNMNNLDKCSTGAYIFGLREFPADVEKKWKDEVKKDPSILKETFESVPKFISKPSDYILFTPLEWILDRKLSPHTIIILVNSEQAHILTSSYFEATGKEITSCFIGRASCQLILNVIFSEKPSIALPCTGARKIAHSTENEIWFGVSLDDLTKIYKRMKESGMKYTSSPLPKIQDIEDIRG